ncbi:hypothetical protein OE88DRAFT_1696189 [Heliocybe sulcata]|uniref:Uncharacterized protein n=1 Tax=Heliocybe sulcata TaxID=5364 RepID=A0A5C3N7T1_9AGAM|nr:hypothetical protein OE88DRAFT_1696189 [Heliocybe sulcata]
MPPSERFLRIYDSLPEDARRRLVEKHLVPLLNAVPPDRCKKSISAALRMQKRYDGIPVLDLKSKKEEVNALLDELERDTKRSFVKGRSIRDELLSEIVDSLTDWLNDIWIVVYEYKVNFEDAHRCLLFAAGVLDHLCNSRGMPSETCKCTFNNMYIHVRLKKRNGRTVKSFSLSGAATLDRVLLWIWRDLLLVMLASEDPRLTGVMPEMLTDIENVVGWQSVERILYGGREGLMPEEAPDDSDEEENWLEDIDDGSPERCTCSYHADHWPDRLNDQIIPLRQLVQDHLLSLFRITPSLELWNSLLTITTHFDSTKSQLQTHLASIATTSSSTFAAALAIHAVENNDESIVSMLDTHAHLLRPRDAPSYQSAVVSLSRNPLFQTRALQMLEKELLESARTVRAALHGSFSEIDKQANKDEFDNIMKLRHGTDARRERIELWVDAIVTPGSQPAHPMAFAAMMIGLPLGAAMADADDADPLGYLDVDQGDPDLEDLREEFRPKLKDRFESWINTAGKVKGGNAILPKAYKEILGWMPFLRASDAIDEMIGRLADRPSKHHVCDGMDALAHFVKVQRKKLAAKADKQKKGSAASASPLTSGSNPTSASAAEAAHPAVPPHAPPSPFAPSTGGLNDVD